MLRQSLPLDGRPSFGDMATGDSAYRFIAVRLPHGTQHDEHDAQDSLKFIRADEEDTAVGDDRAAEVPERLDAEGRVVRPLDEGAVARVLAAARAEGIVYSNLFTGVHGNYLRSSIEAAGMDPDNLPVSDPSKMNFSTGEGSNSAKAWKDIWGCGQGIGAIREVVPAADLVARLKREYAEAKARICGM